LDFSKYARLASAEEPTINDVEKLIRMASGHAPLAKGIRGRGERKRKK